MMGSVELLILFLLTVGGSLGLPLGMPPGPEDPLMSAIAPEDCLAWSTWSPSVAPRVDGNVTERWMAQPELLNSWDKAKTALLAYGVATADPEAKHLVQAASDLGMHVMTHAAAIYVSDIDSVEPYADFTAGALIDFADEGKALAGKAEILLSRFATGNETDVKVVTIGDRDFHMTERLSITWGMIDDRHFAITIGDGEMERLVERSQTPPPAWLDELRQRLPVPRVSSVSWIDGGKFLEVVERLTMDEPDRDTIMEALTIAGLRNIQGIGFVTGLDDEGFLSRAHVAIDGEPTGIPGVFSDEPLTIEKLGRIPGDRMFATALALSPGRIYQLIRDFAALDENSEEEFRQAIASLNESTGFDLERDVFGEFDDFLFAYGSPILTSPSAGWVFGAGASREMALTDPYEEIIRFVERAIEDNPDYELDRAEVGGSVTYTLDDRSEWSFMPDVSWSLGGSELVMSLDKASLRRHVRRESGADDALVNDPWFARAFRNDVEGDLVLVSSFDLAKMIELGLPVVTTFGEQFLPDELDFSLADLPSIESLTREMKPGVSAVYRTRDGFEILQWQTYPGGSPVSLILIGLFGTVSPAHVVERAPAEVASANTMRQLILSLHEYHEAHGQTAIILEVQGENAVVWTSPEDYKWEDAMSPEAGLYDAGNSGVNIGMADGSIRYVEWERLADIFEALARKSDGRLDVWDE